METTERKALFEHYWTELMTKGEIECDHYRIRGAIYKTLKSKHIPFEVTNLGNTGVQEDCEHGYCRYASLSWFANNLRNGI